MFNIRSETWRRSLSINLENFAIIKMFFVYSVVTENEENTFVVPGMNC